MQQAVQEEVVRMAEPAQLLDVVAELDEGDREHLTASLVDAHFISEDRRPFLEDAVRPGGYADKLNQAIRFINVARRHVWVALAIPFVELILSWTLMALLHQGSVLFTWMEIDACLQLGLVMLVYMAGKSLAPAWRELQADPISVVGRFQHSDRDASLIDKVSVALPGIDPEGFRHGVNCGIAALLVVAFGAVWAVFGILQWLASVALGTVGIILLCSFLFIGLRLAIVTAVGIVFLQFTKKLATLRSGAQRPPELAGAHSGG